MIIRYDNCKHYFRDNYGVEIKIAERHEDKVLVFVPLTSDQLTRGETVTEEFENGCYVETKDYHRIRSDRGFKTPSERISPLEQRVIMLEEKVSKLEDVINTLLENNDKNLLLK